MKLNVNKLNIITANILISLIPIIIYYIAMDTIIISIGRFGFAALSIFIYFFIKNRQTLLISIHKKKIQYLFLSGIFHASTTFTFFIAIKYTTPTFAVLSLSIGLLLYTAASNYLRYKNKYKTYILLYIISLSILMGTFINKILSIHALYILIAIISGISMASVFFVGEYTKKYFTNIQITFYQNLIAFILLITTIPLLVINYNIPSTTSIIYLMVLGIIATAIPYIMIYKSIEKVGAMYFSILNILQIVPAILFDITIGKNIDIYMVIGSFVIIILLYIGSIKEIPNFMKITMEQIQKIAIDIDHDQAFAGKSNGNKHLFRVVEIAKYLAKKENANIFITTAGAWLHDTALPSGDDYNYENNKKIIQKILKNISLKKDKKEAIVECVASHEGTVTPQGLEAKIVHDADVLEKTGILGVIRHTWKLTNLGKIDPKNIKNEDVKTINSHIEWRKSVLYTESAKKLADYLSIDLNIIDRELISFISQQADKGVITEIIAKTLQGKIPQDIYKKLEEQISQTYL